MNTEGTAKGPYDDLVAQGRVRPSGILGSQGLHAIGTASDIACNQQKKPRKYIGELITEAHGSLLELFESIETLSGRLSAVVDAPNCANGCSPENQVNGEPAFVNALDNIVERINVARQLVNSLTERVRV